MGAQAPSPALRAPRGARAPHLTLQLSSPSCNSELGSFSSNRSRRRRHWSRRTCSPSLLPPGSIGEKGEHPEPLLQLMLPLVPLLPLYVTLPPCTSLRRPTMAGERH
jgi:hypothetical protein